MLDMATAFCMRHGCKMCGIIIISKSFILHTSFSELHVFPMGSVCIIISLSWFLSFFLTKKIIVRLVFIFLKFTLVRALVTPYSYMGKRKVMTILIS